jgi:hypothetical protein
MAQGKRVEVSAAQRADIWRVGRRASRCMSLGAPTAVSILELSHHGGIVPAVRRRSPKVLTLSEREETSRGIALGSSMRRHGVGPATQALPTGPAGAAARVGGELTDPGLVARTGCRMLETPASQGQEPACVPRDHLSKPVPSSPWSVEKRADLAFTVQALHTPLAARDEEGPSKGADHRCPPHRQRGTNRKHQSSLVPISAQENRSVTAYPGSARRDSAAPESTPAKTLEFQTPRVNCKQVLHPPCGFARHIVHYRQPPSG